MDLASCVRARRCRQIAGGRLEKRIFGNGILSEDCSDQVLACFPFAGRVTFVQEMFVRAFENLFGVQLRANASFGEGHERTAHGEAPFFSESAYLDGKFGGNSYALAHRSGPRTADGRLGSTGHNSF